MKLMPTGTINIIKAPFNSLTDSHKVLWMSQPDQTVFFDTLPMITLPGTNYSIVSNGVIRISGNYEVIKQYNYLTFKEDEDYHDKVFYCFITDVKNANQGMCDLYIAIDECQTWFFDGSKKRYFSTTPRGKYKDINPQKVELYPGSQMQFKALFVNDRCISQLANYYHAYDVSGIDISIDGKLTIDTTVPSGTSYVVIARDRILGGSSVEAEITVI